MKKNMPIYFRNIVTVFTLLILVMAHVLPLGCNKEAHNTTMTNVPRIPAEEARQLTVSGESLLVCAYDDEKRCRELLLDGAMTLQEFTSKLPDIPKDKDIIFYCT